MRQNFHPSRLLTPHLRLLLIRSFMSIPPTQTSQSSVPTSQSPYLSNSTHSCHSSHNSASLIPIPDPIPVPFIASSSSSLTNPSAPHNSHLMITQSKVGTLRKNFFWLINLLNLIISNKPPRIQIGFQPWKRNTKLSYKTIPGS